MSRAMTHPWLEAVDRTFCDRRFERSLVDRRLAQSELTYREPWPRVDASARLVVHFVTKAMVPAKLAVRIDGDTIERACTCGASKSQVCVHVMDTLIDLAFVPQLREALAKGTGTEAIIARMGDARRRALEDRTLDERIARWLPDGRFEDALELDVTVAASTGMPTPDPRPALFLRHRRTDSRAIVRPRDLLDARLPPSRRRLVELTTPSSIHKDALVAVHAQASLLLELLRNAPAARTNGFRSPLVFSAETARPHVVCEDQRLLAEWRTETDLRWSTAHGLLFAGPFPFVWSTAHERFFPVAADVDLDAAWGLSFFPSLPFDEDASKRILPSLLSRGRGLGVVWPSHEALGGGPVETPTFTLRLFGSLLDVRADLVAHYGSHAVVVDPRAACPSVLRDEGAERRALEVLREAGLESSNIGSLPVENGIFCAEEDRAIEFWRRGLGVVESSVDPAISVRIDEGLVRGHVRGPIAADISASGEAGWLDLDLTFTAGALKIEMAAIRRALRDRRKWLTLDDGTIVEITRGIQELVGDASRVLGGEERNGPVPMHHLAEVRAWIDHHGGRLDEAARRLLDRLGGKESRQEPRLPRDLRATLRPYQRDGLAWLETLRQAKVGGILADDMGLGKTLITLTLLARWKEDEGPSPALVVCPTSLLGNWRNETEKFTSLSVCILHRSSDARSLGREPADLVVTTYGILRREIGRLSRFPFRAVILDEAQNIKNEGAETTRAAHRLRGQLRLALTGTPVENRARELWSLATFANPGILGTAREFRERFDDPLAHAPDGATAAHLRDIVRPFLLRRTKAQVLGELPPKTEVERTLVLSDREKRHYDALARTLQKSVKKNIEKRGIAGSRIAVLTAILRLRQMACDPRLIDPNIEEPSAKRTAFLELAREIKASSRKALVFSQFVGLLTLWREDLDREGIAYEYLDGASTDREAIVARFQDGPSPLFLISLKAGGAGLNLTAADTVIHCDPWWNPAAEDQATDRAHRIGQTRPVTVVRLHAQGTIEEKIAILKGRKRRLARVVLDGPRDVAADEAQTDATGRSMDGAVELADDEQLELIGVTAADPTSDEAAASSRKTSV